MVASAFSMRWMDLLIGFLFVTKCYVTGLDEDERMKEYHLRKYSWPLPEVVPNTAGWRRIMDRRFRQIEQISDTNDKYNGWVQVMSSALVAPNFTEFGWGLTRAPEDLVQELREALHKGLENPRFEHNINVIDGPNTPYFVHIPNLKGKVLRELQPIHETWSNITLAPSIAYGLRAYRDEASLFMHVDKSTTHVISSILHVDHSEDSEPWPIVIEDYEGNTNEVYLESGDMLLYESSKCFHGRPKKFKGSWYSSIFVHYRPAEDWQDRRDLESHYAVPKHWFETRDHNEDTLQMVGTSLKEPDCEHNWCPLKDSRKWYGPGPTDGRILTGSDWEEYQREGEEL